MCELQNKYLTQNTVKVSVHTGRTLQSVAVNHQLLEKRELWPKVENKDHRFVRISLFLLNPLHFSADQLPPSSRSSIQNITVEAYNSPGMIPSKYKTLTAQSLIATNLFLQTLIHAIARCKNNSHPLHSNTEAPGQHEELQLHF